MWEYMPASFREITIEIGANFQKAKSEQFGKHPLADKIRNSWPEGIKAILKHANKDDFKFDASPGAGQWNSAPWLAVLHPSITTSAQAGYYPVYLYEPGFETICLVMGQGAEKLEQAVGKKKAILELSSRAEALRKGTEKWKSSGFDAGPFETMREAAAKRKKMGSDTRRSLGCFSRIRQTLPVGQYAFGC